MALSTTSKPNNAVAEWIEGAVALIFCLGCVGVGWQISDHPHLTVPIILATVVAYMPLAVWITKRRWARGQRSIF